jgi:hypothetical protein
MSGFILQTDITDHMTLSICPKIGVKHETNKLSEKTYSTPLPDTRYLSYLLRDYLKTAKWESVTSDLSVNAFTTFQSKIKEATSIWCPLTEKTFKDKPIEPWYSLGLLNSKYTLSKLFRKARTKKTTEAWARYKSYRNLYYKLIKTAKYIFYKKEFSAANNNSRKIWDLSKQITGLGKSKGRVWDLGNTRL